MRAWLARAGAAASLAMDRPGLWPAGALAWVAYLGWLPLPAVILGSPTTADVAFLGAELYGASSYPWNVLLLSAALALLLISAVLAAALGQATLLRAVRGASVSGSSVSHDAGAIFSLTVAASLPLLVSMALLVWQLVAVAPLEFTRPDAGATLGWRLAARLAPWLALSAVALLVVQSAGAAITRRAVGREALGPMAAIRAGLADLVAAFPSRACVAIGTLLADVVLLAVSIAVLRVLWAPIGALLAGGALLVPESLGLVAAFVAIWLALTLAAGAQQLFVAAWWSLELERDGYHRAVPDPA